MVWSEKQSKFILEANAIINLAHGSVRAGKTHSSLFRWAKHIAECPDSDLMMIGYSLETLYYNAILPFMEMFRGYCEWYPGNHVLSFLDKRIRCIGASDQSATGKIQGPTLSGAYCDEIVLYPESFVRMLLTRLSRPHSKMFATMNPDSPYNYIKTELIDKHDDKYVYALHFNLDDNPNLPEDYKNMLKKFYSGLWYRRYILGEWVMAEGCVYDMFDRKFHVVSRSPYAAQFYIVGVDYGAATCTAAVVVGVNRQHHPGLWVEKEYYWDVKETGRQKTNSQFVDDLETLMFGMPIKAIYLDPSAESLQIEMQKRHMKVFEANNDVQEGIRVVSNFLSQGDLVLHESCTSLIKEIEGYVWDAKKVQKGIDEPKKERDHACDALRYALYTHFPRQRIQPPRVDLGKPANLMDKPGFGDGFGWQSFGGGPSMPIGRR